MTAAGAKDLAALLAGGQVEDGVFRALVEALPVAIYTTDAQGRLTYFNKAAAKLSGGSPHLGTDQWCVTLKISLANGTHLPYEQCPMALALQGVEVPMGIECLAERPDGSRFWFSPFPAVVRDAGGRIIGGINLLIDITDRKNAEIEANEQFRSVVETTPECVMMMAGDGTLLFMNTPGQAMIGAPSGDAMVGRKVYDWIADEDRERFRTMNERVCQGEKAHLEFDIVGLDGSRRHMETHAAPLRHTDGTVVHVAVARDVTERQRSERDAMLLGAIVASSDDAIISKNLDGVITSWNYGAERLFGYPPREAIGTTVAELLIPEDRQDEEPNILERLRRGERVDHFETVRKRKDGTLLDISLTISPVKDSRGQIIGASKIARDISERKRAEAELARSRQTFFELVERAPFGVYVVDSGLRIVPMNAVSQGKAFRNVRPAMGRPLGEAMHILWPPEIAEEVVAIFRHTLETGEPFVSTRFTRPRRDVRAVESYEWELHRIVLPNGQYGVICYYFDSTELRNVEAALRNANRDLEQFAFSASHDLQEPLRSIKIYSELLASRYGNLLDGDAGKFVGFLRTGATRMETLLHDLLAYTRVTQLDEPAESLDAGQALGAALANLSSAISEAAATVSSGSLPSVAVHPTHLQQLFQNLIGNAIKYRSPERPPAIRVEAEQQGGNWIFAVIDNGIGIEPEYRETIFGLFKRLHGSDEYSGTGIGLALCQRIVNRYHGRIWVESEPGQGSAFRFAIPA